MQALVAMAEEHTQRISGEPWMYGAFALAVLLLALFAVTRLNPKRWVSHRRLGVLGGTFDPPHAGHVAIARAALEQGMVDEVVVVPAGDPWQKSGVTPAAHRLAMTQLAFADIPGVRVSDLETRREGPTFAVDTVRELLRLPDTDVSYLVGADALANLGTWHDVQLLVALCSFIVVPRPGAPIVVPEIDGLRVTTLDMPPVDVSSTGLRAGHVRSFLPPDVADYIDTHDLYRGTDG